MRSGQEQLIVALHFATTLLDAGASVVGEDNSGRHAPLEGVGGAKNAGRNLKGDSAASSTSALRSYPLMWAAAAVLRSGLPVPEGGRRVRAGEEAARRGRRIRRR